MMEIEWSPRAQHDLLTTLAWLLSRSPTSAERAAEDILGAVQSAARRPYANRSAQISDSSSSRIKSLPKWHKIIIYKVEPDRIVIVSIRDTRQEVPE